MLTAGYFLWMLQRVNMGGMPDRWQAKGFRDILTVEWVSWLPLLALILILGLFPAIIFNVTQHGAQALASLFGG